MTYSKSNLREIPNRRRKKMGGHTRHSTIFLSYPLFVCIPTSIAAGKTSRALPTNLPPFKGGASPSAANKSTSRATSPTSSTEELKPHCEPQRKCSKGLSNFSMLLPITRRSPSRSADNSPTVENILPGCALERTTAKPMPHLPESPRDRQMGTTNP